MNTTNVSEQTILRIFTNKKGGVNLLFYFDIPKTFYTFVLLFYYNQLKCFAMSKYKLIKVQDKPKKYKGFVLIRKSDAKEGKVFIVISDGLTSHYDWVDAYTVLKMTDREIIDYMIANTRRDNRYVDEYYKIFPEEYYDRL